MWPSHQLHIPPHVLLLLPHRRSDSERTASDRPLGKRRETEPEGLVLRWELAGDRAARRSRTGAATGKTPRTRCGRSRSADPSKHFGAFRARERKATSLETPIYATPARKR